jgi:hypothetical protein
MKIEKEKRMTEASKEKKAGNHSDAHLADGHGIDKALSLFGNHSGPASYEKRAGMYVEGGFGKAPRNRRNGKIY